MKKTLTLIRAKYLFHDVIIPVIEDESYNFEFAKLITSGIEGDGGFSIIGRPLWNYLNDQQDIIDFISNFFQENENRKVVPLECLIKDHDDPQHIETPLGNFELPKEYSFTILAVVKDNDKQYMHLPETKLPILIIDKKNG